jgi:hypothetical protein
MLWRSVMIKDILSSRNIINEIINLAKLMIKDILSSWNIINESINLAKFYSKFLFFPCSSYFFDTTTTITFYFTIIFPKTYIPWSTTSTTWLILILIAQTWQTKKKVEKKEWVLFLGLVGKMNSLKTN